MREATHTAPSPAESSTAKRELSQRLSAIASLLRNATSRRCARCTGVASRSKAGVCLLPQQLDAWDLLTEHVRSTVSGAVIYHYDFGALVGNLAREAIQTFQQQAQVVVCGDYD